MRDAREDREAFRTTRLLTIEGASLNEDTCRVCRGIVRVGEPIRKRQWHVEIAHASCGWLRLPEEHDPHERRRPGTFFTYWEWRCPYCGLDACAVRRPRDDDDPRCRRCRPASELGAGVVAELLSGVSFRVGRGKRPRLVRLEAYSRVRVLKVSGELAHVTTIDRPEGLETWVRLLTIQSV